MGVKKEAHICTVNCPHCDKPIDIIKETEVHTPAQKAEKDVTFKAAKASTAQTQF